MGISGGEASSPLRGARGRHASVKTAAAAAADVKDASGGAGSAAAAAAENTFVTSIARQGAGEDDGVTLDDLLAKRCGGPPRFFSPLTAAAAGGGRDARGRPTMVYVPGLDGTGFAASAQFEGLSEYFNLVALNVPVGDRSTYEALVDVVVAFLESERDARGETETETETYLLGESMGGLVSLGVAQKRPDLVDKLVLVNPASSYDASPWPALGPLLPMLPEDLYRGLPYALAPVLFDTPRLLQGAVAAAVAGAQAGAGIGGASTSRSSEASPFPDLAAVGIDAGDPAAGLAAAAAELARLFPALGQLSNIIPRETLSHRLSILAAGCRVVNAPGALEGTRTPTLAVISSADALIPSAEEGPRLKRLMRKCAVETLEGASHAALQEAGVDLPRILRRNGFLPRQPSDAPPLTRDRTFTPPSPAELERGFESLAVLRGVVSPVFFSTRRDGKVVPGIDAVPLSEGDRPVLLVGNHQTLAPDLGFLIQEFVQKRGVLIRGLAHPVVAGGARGRVGGGDGARGASDVTDEVNDDEPGFRGLPDLSRVFRALGERRGDGQTGQWQRGRRSPQAGTGPFGEGGPGGISTFTTFGAVPVTGRNFYKLLAAGECVLLFPGGVREAFKRKNEDYKLFWPSKPEFIRMAVRHGATIVPFAAVGAEDGIEIVADADDIVNLPFGLGQAAAERSREVPAARAVDTRVTEDGGAEETFVQPLVVPKTPQRYYFKFGKPVDTDGLYQGGFLDNDEEVRAMYDEVRRDVEDGIDWLLRRRSEDPFRDTALRTLYETAQGGKQAPTFNP